MSNQMDNSSYNVVNPSNSGIPSDFRNVFQNAMQNPSQFESMFKNSNPQAYDMAMQLRNSSNPRDAIIRMAQAKGINPAMLMQMLGIR